MVWTGAGLYGTLLACWVVTLTGIDPDRSPVAFFLVLSPVLLILGGALFGLSGHLRAKWSTVTNPGPGYQFNVLCGHLKCDFSDMPTVFFIPMPLLSVVSLIIALVIWAGVFK
jgi:hypothetical protein